MYKLSVFIPESHLDEVKSAMFLAGAGRIGNYDQCCWQVKGQGQFRPLDGANPYIGAQGAVEYVDEYKVEMVCEDSLLVAVIAAMKSSHPYEEPAYDIIQLFDL
ncbi:YqfO family protein [Litoribrevibacter albus]|uniref:NIF3 1 protein n=1 Tax=Litoribrevibacter albus TaxID=1473156 RepID=A0AA37SBF9_9GAMM|nr:YqfO family protein [Litoribrevibacter albus]GLQ32064.1 NIF3 1 protein [Litoribrevibacter albus]